MLFSRYPFHLLFIISNISLKILDTVLKIIFSKTYFLGSECVTCSLFAVRKYPENAQKYRHTHISLITEGNPCRQACGFPFFRPITKERPKNQKMNIHISQFGLHPICMILLAKSTCMYVDGIVAYHSLFNN